MLRNFKSGLFFTSACALSISVGLFYYFKPGPEPDIFTLSGFTMGTSYQIQIVPNESAFKQELLSQKIQQTLTYLDKALFSTYVENSELSRFNQSQVNQPFSASVELLEVISKAKIIYQQSNHRFDITVSPLVELWGFGTSPSRNTLPTETQIQQALNKLGTEAVETSFENKTLLKTKSIQLDLSGIAKGYAVDQIATLLVEQGFNNFLVEVGGELKVHGRKSNGQAWTLAIESPDNTQRTVFTTFTSNGENIAVAGSGDYRNYFELSEQRYSHQIDPSTGKPINHKLAAVSVISQDAATADAYATALMILGPEQGFSLASRNNLAAYFIIRTEFGYEKRYTESFTPYLSTQPQLL